MTPLAVAGLSTGAAWDHRPDRRMLSLVDADVAMAPWTVERVRGGWLLTCCGCGGQAGGRMLSDATRGMWRLLHGRTCTRGVLVSRAVDPTGDWGRRQIRHVVLMEPAALAAELDVEVAS